MVMGNSVRQWQASYNSTFRRRAVAGAVVAHPTFISNMAKRDRQRGGGGGALEGEDEAIEEGVEGEGVEEEIEELGRRREPIQINSQPGRRNKRKMEQKATKATPSVAIGSGHTNAAQRDGGNFLDPKRQEMRWGGMDGGW